MRIAAHFSPAHWYLSIAISLGAVSGASGSDIFGTTATIPASVPGRFDSGGTGDFCRSRPLSSPAALFEVIERSLCESPKTRAGWAAIKSAAANVGISKSAYLPTLGADAKYLYQHESTQVSDSPQLQSHFERGVNSESLSLGWVLYDFGSRSASLQQTRELLLAAQANHDEALQSVFATTARDYFAAQASNASVWSTRKIESAARENVDAASARVAKGIVPVTDQLQANTALAQAVYERAKAEGQARAAVGALAVDMNISPDEPVTLPELDTGALPDVSFAQAVHQMLEDARQTHPKVLSAAAQWQAALANVRFSRAQGLPVLRLVGESDRSNQPVSASLGQPELPALTRDNYIGVRIEIPLFDGFRREYQVRQAEAQADVQQANLRDVEQQVAIGVWSSVQTLQTDTDNLRNTDLILRSARAAFEAAQHRYQSGVGNILELLAAQNTLAAAEQQRIQAQLDWRTARLQLAASMGNIGMWLIE